MVFVGIIMASCEKQDTPCDFYYNNNIDLKQINSGQDAGKCYYYESGKKVLLTKEACAGLCD